LKSTKLDSLDSFLRIILGISKMKTATRKIKSRNELRSIVCHVQAENKRVVFTNGCFDILHLGHVRFLEKARTFGDVLVVAVNSDVSVKKNKGKSRPVIPQYERMEIISALGCVDFVTIFEEGNPRKIIRELLPDVLVKGGDWSSDRIVGRNIIELNGGEVVLIDFEKGFSTTKIIERVQESERRTSPQSSRDTRAYRSKS